MDINEIRQQLLQLENRDTVKLWFSKIHKRTLSTLRAKEINSAAKQSAEFFRNAENATYTVRPLLTYYAILSLSRALILLLRTSGGENTLVEGHGLKTLDWSGVLSGNDLNENLKQIGGLKVLTCNGIFSELIKETENRISIHLNSSTVEWHVNYDMPDKGYVFTLDDLLSRIPDFQHDIAALELNENYAVIKYKMSYSDDKGFYCEVSDNREDVVDAYHQMGYTSVTSYNKCDLRCDAEIFKQKMPQFLHKYMHKSMGVIPSLYLIRPFDETRRYSELAIVFLMSYYLGMLVRYYPTHWNALVQGDNGDIYWPVLNRAQTYVEKVFPELVIELLNDMLQDK